jgi:type IV pilus biogenesis protein CpaD/CtpE
MVKLGDSMRSKALHYRILAVLMLLILNGCGKKEEAAPEAVPKVATSEPACLANLKPKTEEERLKKCPPGFIPSADKKW